MKYCPSCGSPIIEGVRYCHECGLDLTTIKVPVIQPPAQQFPRYVPRAIKPPPKKAIMAIILAIVTAVVIFIAGVLPWWTVTNDEWGGNKTDFTLHEVVVESDRGDNKVDLEVIPGSDLDSVADNTFRMLLLSIVIMIIVIVFLGLLIWFYYTGFHGNIKIFRNLSQLLMIIAMILVLLAPFYYMVAWTQEFDGFSSGTYDTFIGSEEDEDGDLIIWGPGIGWILAIGSLVLILFTLFFTRQGFAEIEGITSQMSHVNNIENLQRHS